MPTITGELTTHGLREDLVLPFLLAWYGWLSKEQGAIAKKRRVVLIKTEATTELSGGGAYLTKRGKRKLNRYFSGEKSMDAGYCYATYLKEYGLISNVPYYIYPGRLLSRNAIALDRYQSIESWGPNF